MRMSRIGRFAGSDIVCRKVWVLHSRQHYLHVLAAMESNQPFVLLFAAARHTPCIHVHLQINPWETLSLTGRTEWLSISATVGPSLVRWDVAC